MASIRGSAYFCGQFAAPFDALQQNYRRYDFIFKVRQFYSVSQSSVGKQLPVTKIQTFVT
jgi:hypothetical protein